LLVLSVFSFGFIDPNLHLSNNSTFVRCSEVLINLIYHARPIATGIFFLILILMFGVYLIFLHREKLLSSYKKLLVVITVSAVILGFSYPAFSYDLFNYITTAKVTFTYHENPYIVMPIEIPNEPYLAFTRAANKSALYGPVWIAITAIPHYLGGGNIWRTIIAFKLTNVLIYLLMTYLIYRVTKSTKNVIFFALNPLVLIEVLVSGHNDIYMMVLALLGLVLWYKKGLKYKLWGGVLIFASWWTKGATAIISPLLFLRKLSLEKALIITYFLLALIFFIATPIREELYPWYAVWLVSTVSLLPLKRHQFLTGFTIVLTFALELRQMPYMWMGYYEGPGPLLRMLVTVIPVVIYLVIFGARKFLKKTA
jgi:hypothetical protein